MARPAIFSFPAQDSAGICATQTVSGSLTINGTTAVQTDPFWYYATLSGFQRCVTLSSANNLSAVNVTVQGRTWSGLAVSETISGPNNSTVSTTSQFMTVSAVSTDATATAMSVGWGNVGQSRPFRPNPYNTPGTVGVGVSVVGTIAYTVRTTYDDVNTVALPTWSGVTGMSGATTSFQTNLGTLPEAVQIVVNSSSGATSALNLVVIPTGV
ncbi:MAG: hypothetical protein RL219_947 [Actinomycetota bacterium]|jgi:hypothetical protein